MASYATLVVACLLLIHGLWKRPARILWFFLFALILVPYWAGVNVGIQLPAVVLITGAALWTLQAVRLELDSADRLMIGMAALMVVMNTAGSVEFYDTAVFIGQWLLPYLLGRGLASTLGELRISYTVALWALVLGGLAILEFVTDWHPFVELFAGTNSYETWSQIQDRAGFSRSEWTFGHSIALGNILAMCIPFIVVARISPTARTLAIVVVLGGIATTLSRNAIITGVVTLMATVLLLGAQMGRNRQVGAALFAAAGCVVGWIGLGGLSDAGGAEVEQSTGARLSQWNLVSEVRWLGLSDTSITLPDGSIGFITDAYSRGFTSTVDNAFLLFALRAGALVAIGLVIVFAVTAVRQLRRRTRTPAGIAVSCQFLTLMSTAFITQYAIVFWLFVGMAMSARQQPALSADTQAKGSAKSPIES